MQPGRPGLRPPYTKSAARRARQQDKANSRGATIVESTAAGRIKELETRIRGLEAERDTLVERLRLANNRIDFLEKRLGEAMRRNRNKFNGR